MSQRFRILTYAMICLSAGWLTACRDAPSAPSSIHFIPAKPDHLRTAEGIKLTKGPKSVGWEWLGGRGQGGILHSQKDKKSDILMIQAENLPPGSNMEVFGYFWADEVAHGNRNDGVAQFGLTMATLQPFDGHGISGEPWIIAPGTNVGHSYGYQTVLEKSEPIPGPHAKTLRSGKSVLVRARLGISRVAKDGTLPVFVASYVGRHPSGCAAIHGIGMRPAPADAEIDPGWKQGTRLHRAVRAGDTITLLREIESGADLNSLDEDHLTALFYAVASDDEKTVRKLIAAGAMPDVSGQSVSPLAAAASISSVKLTRLLLESGAKVPLEQPVSGNSKLAVNPDPRFLHPVNTALRVGSVPVLKLLLEHTPGIDMKVICAPEKPSQPNHSYFPMFYMETLSRAIQYRHWEMAGFLLEHPLPGITDEQKKNPGDNRDLLVTALNDSGPDAMNFLETAIKLGIPPVKMVYSDEGIARYDALRMAVCLDRVDLVRRWLPLATAENQNYHRSLAQIAVGCGNKEIIGMIREQMPEAMPQAPSQQNISARPSTSPLDESRLLLPRTNPSPVTGQAAGAGHVMAIIMPPDALEIASDLMTAVTATPGWKAVGDRDSVEASLEDNGQKNLIHQPWLSGEHRLSDLGDSLGADCIVIASTSEKQGLKTCRFDVVDVRSGMEIHREHLRSDSDMTAFVERATIALEAAANDRLEAITFRSFDVSNELRDSLVIRQILCSVLRRDVKETPGFIALSSDQSRRLIEEQSLQRAPSLWAASHAIDGSVTAVDKNRIRVELRLETIRDGKITHTNASRTGGIKELSTIAASLWTELTGKIGATAPPVWVRTHDSTSECMRLLQQAELLLAMNESPNRILPVIEEAVALGIRPEWVLPAHLDAMFRRISIFNSVGRSHENGHPRWRLNQVGDLKPLPVEISMSDRLTQQLPEARELLHQTSWYLNVCGRSYMDTADGESGMAIWHSIEFLAYIRAAIVVERMDAESQAFFGTFGAELDDLIRRYFVTLREINYPKESLCAPSRKHYRVLVRNPELVNCMVDYSLRAISLRHILGNGDHHCIKFLAEQINRRIGDNPDPYLAYKKADIEFLISSTSDAPQAARRLIDAGIKLNRCKDRDYGEIEYLPASRDKIDLHTTSYLFQAPWPLLYIFHGSCTLPPLLHSPRPAPDQYLKFTHYFFASNICRLLGNTRKDTRVIYYDPLQFQYNGYPTDGSGHFPPGDVCRSRVRRATFQIRDTSTALPELLLGKVKPPPTGTDAKNPLPVITAKPLLDLRGGTPVGLCIWPLVDQADPNRLWLHYFESIDKEIPAGLPKRGAQLSGDHWIRPRLVAVDCRNGNELHRIDLQKEAGLLQDGHANPNRIWNMALAQTKNHLMADAGGRLLIVDKRTGQSGTLPDKARIQEGKYDNTYLRSGVAGVGEHFYFLDEARADNGGSLVNNNGYAVFQVGADREVRPFTVTGRRPGKTPFDAIDQQPRAITCYNGSLAVANASILSSFDPIVQTWSEETRAHPNKYHMFPVYEDQYWKHLSSLNEIRTDGKFTGWTVISWNRGKGCIRVAHREKGERVFQAVAEIPEDFRLGAIACQPTGPVGRSDYKRTSIDECPTFQMPDLSVVAQTDEHLVFAMNTGNHYEWQWPSRNGLLMPFLWTVSKKELLEMLEPTNHAF